MYVCDIIFARTFQHASLKKRSSIHESDSLIQFSGLGPCLHMLPICLSPLEYGYRLHTTHVHHAAAWVTLKIHAFFAVGGFQRSTPDEPCSRCPPNWLTIVVILVVSIGGIFGLCILSWSQDLWDKALDEHL